MADSVTHKEFFQKQSKQQHEISPADTETTLEDMQETIKKIANQTSISDNHIVNAWSMLRDPKR